jgi:predicted porin
MNNTIKLAVASALLAAASSANAGIMIPAGDWTLDIGGVVNAYYTSTKVSGTAANDTGTKRAANITTGLLPNYLSVSGKTRQNDLDVGFTISLQPGASTKHSGQQTLAGIADTGTNQENRQAFVTFGDASWGSIKLGKDLGIYASDAILNDMTLLGVGSAAGALAGNTTTLGRIGTGFMYADWKSQVAYSSPNFNGFSFTAGLTQGWNTGTDVGRAGSETAYEGKAAFDFSSVVGNGVTGKVWASGISQKLANIAALTGGSTTAHAWDLGANVGAMGFGLTGYYGQGKGTGTTVLFNGALDAAGTKRKSDDWYVQGTYTLPGVGTKLGVSYGESTLKGTAVERTASLVKNTNEMITFGAYHPITKHLNLVAEYSEQKAKHDDFAALLDTSGKAKTVSLGGILFF